MLGVPSTAEILTAHGQTLKADIHTGIPAKVILYDPLTNTLACEVAVKEPLFLADGDREYTALPTLLNVPVHWPRFGGKVVRGMIDPGDWVWLAFSEASLAEWRSTAQVSSPVDARRLSIGYPFATPGAFPDCQPLDPTDAIEVASGAMIIGEDGGDQILIGGLLPGIRCGKLAVMPVALAPPLVTALAAVAAYIAALTAALVANPAVYAGFAAAMAAPGATVATALGLVATAVPSTLTKSE